MALTMIKSHINPAGVEKVVFDSNSHMEEDFDFAAWQTIRPLVDKIDRTLRRIVSDLNQGPKEGSR